jgi:hypothetical protein
MLISTSQVGLKWCTDPLLMEPEEEASPIDCDNYSIYVDLYKC